MIEGLFAKGSIPVMKTALAFAEDRHRVIVNNIANAETPGYVARDLPLGAFQRALQAAAKERQERHPRHFELSGEGIRPRPGGYEVDPVDRFDNLMRHDGNTFSPEQEMSHLMENAGYHGMVAKMLTQQYNLIAAAIRGRP